MASRCNGAVLPIGWYLGYEDRLRGGDRVKGPSSIKVEKVHSKKLGNLPLGNDGLRQWDQRRHVPRAIEMQATWARRAESLLHRSLLGEVKVGISCIRRSESMMGACGYSHGHWLQATGNRHDHCVN